MRHEQAREKAVHLWNRLTCVGHVMKQSQQGHPETTGLEQNLEDWVDVTGWSKGKRKSGRETKVNEDTEERA